MAQHDTPSNTEYKIENRVDILYQLSNDNDTLDEFKFSRLLTDYYDQFVAFCDELLTNKRGCVVKVSCSLSEETVHFNSEEIVQYDMISS